MAGKKKLPPAPKCERDCVRCDIGTHCGKQPKYGWGSRVVVGRLVPKSASVRSNKHGLLVFFLAHPFSEELLEFLLAVCALMNRKRVHGIGRSHKTLFAAGFLQCFFVRDRAPSTRPNSRMAFDLHSRKATSASNFQQDVSSDARSAARWGMAFTTTCSWVA
jgi:hypothetical protein